MAVQFQSIAPVGPLLVADLTLSYAELGLLIGLYLLPGAALALPGGLLGQRFGNRPVVLSALGLMVGGGLVTAASHSLWMAGAGRRDISPGIRGKAQIGPVPASVNEVEMLPPPRCHVFRPHSCGCGALRP